MTCKKLLESVFSSGVFSTTWKLLMIINCWVSGLITLDDAQELCTECGFIFTSPTATGQTILTDNSTTPTTYTFVTLITAYHDNDFLKSSAIPKEVFKLIDTLQSNGYLTTSEQTSLKGLKWN